MKKFKTAKIKPKLFPIKGKFSKQLNELHESEKIIDRPKGRSDTNRWLGRLARTLLKLTALLVVGTLFSLFLIWLSTTSFIGFIIFGIIVIGWVGKMFYDDSAKSA